MAVSNTPYGSRNTAWDYLFNKATLGVAASSPLDCQDVFSNASAQFSFPSAPATISVNLEGSMDGVTWTVLATSTAVTTNTVSASGTMFRLLRANVTAVTGGASPTITVIAGAQVGVAGGVVSGTVSASQSIPTAANILSNAITVANSVTATTVITIPANRTWYGTINVLADNLAATAADVNAAVKTAGATVTPAAGTVLSYSMDSGATGTGLAGTSGPTFVSAGTSAATLTLTNATATTFTSYASANGILL
jgi:hypothetical protein